MLFLQPQLDIRPPHNDAARHWLVRCRGFVSASFAGQKGIVNFAFLDVIACKRGASVNNKAPVLRVTTFHVGLRCIENPWF